MVKFIPSPLTGEGGGEGGLGTFPPTSILPRKGGGDFSGSYFRSNAHRKKKNSIARYQQPHS
jgi:hypothetical protein